MEYLQPIKTLESKVALYRTLLIVSIVLLFTAIIAIPMATTQGNPFIVKTSEAISIAKKEPWKLSVTRVEEFLNFYLKSRFEWNESNFEDRKGQVQTLTTDPVFAKLKESLAAFEALNKSQKARSFFILEGYGFSNEKHQIEAHIVRVLRIGKVAFATPLVIQLEYRDSAITDADPYGLVVSAVSEAEVN